jgi:hypothetical protein
MDPTTPERLSFDTPECVADAPVLLRAVFATSCCPARAVSVRWARNFAECSRLATCPHQERGLDREALALSFFVSKDEEYVRLYVLRGRLAFDLGARAHNYLLLTLARRHLADKLECISEPACGWTYLADLAHDPSMAGSRLNLDVFRIRGQFKAVGLDQSEIIERRATTKQIRVGIAQITITSI